jgi:hypothetical protein
VDRIGKGRQVNYFLEAMFKEYAAKLKFIEEAAVWCRSRAEKAHAEGDEFYSCFLVLRARQLEEIAKELRNPTEPGKEEKKDFSGLKRFIPTQRKDPIQ